MYFYNIIGTGDGWDNHKFKATLGFIVKSCLKIRKARPSGNASKPRNWIATSCEPTWDIDSVAKNHKRKCQVISIHP